MATYHCSNSRVAKATRHLEKMGSFGSLRAHERAFAGKLAIMRGDFDEARQIFRDLIGEMADATSPNDVYVRCYASAVAAELEGTSDDRDHALRAARATACNASLRAWLPLEGLMKIADAEGKDLSRSYDCAADQASAAPNASPPG
jgi:ATP/maltotriose-dependent transcriptional regulator MalT